MMMGRDLRGTPEFEYTRSYYERLYRPAFGEITTAAELAVSPDQRRIALTGAVIEALEGATRQCIAIVDVDTGALRRVTFGAGHAMGAKWSPSGELAFLSDRAEPGIFQAYRLCPDEPSDVAPLPAVEGVVEYLDWSPDGRYLLLGVAGAGAETSGMQGSTTTQARPVALPAWMPQVQSGFDATEWRRLWIWDRLTDRCRCVTRPGRNVWEATWSGSDRLLAVLSAAPDEAAWYTAELCLIDIADGSEQVIHRPQDQLGIPAATRGGRTQAVIEAVCSDRAVVAGRVLVRTGEQNFRAIDTHSVDVTHLRWRDERRLVAIGERAFETVVIEYDVESDTTRELWASADVHCGFWYPAVAALGSDSAVFVAEGYLHPPELVRIKDGQLQRIRSFAHAETADHLQAGLYGDRVEAIRWQSADGLEIHGHLLLPPGKGPFPLIMEVHGGPIWANRSRWMGGIRAEPQAFVHRGYAVFRPNPRGSGGRGQDYARRVVGDMGGKDTHDLLSGLDELVRRRLAHPDQLGVMGVSYGGFMSSWLITQDARFKAAIPISPVTNWVSMQWTTNVPHFVRQFLDNAPLSGTGLYHGRSPVSFADRVTTPTLLVGGALDRISPPEQAVEFYRALRQHGCESALVLYPEEGHNVRAMPATIDASARYIDWFDRHLLGRTSRPAAH